MSNVISTAYTSTLREVPSAVMYMYVRRNCLRTQAGRARTVAVDEADGEEEGQNVEEEPKANLDKPAAMLQVLVALVALVPDANHRHRHQPEEQLRSRQTLLYTSAELDRSCCQLGEDQLVWHKA